MSTIHTHKKGEDDFFVPEETTKSSQKASHS
jgi:hypothetical protein